MAKNTVRHVNLVDDSGQVYCHSLGEIVALEGPHVATNCWQCPYWTGLAGGYGVECTYKDDNLGKGVEEMTYRNAEDARDHAPEKVGNPNSIADKDAIKSTDLRMKVQGNPEQVADEIKKIKEDEADTDQEIEQEKMDDGPISAPEEYPPVTDTAVVQMKKATVADVIKAIKFR